MIDEFLFIQKLLVVPSLSINIINTELNLLTFRIGHIFLIIYQTIEMTIEENTNEGTKGNRWMMLSKEFHEMIGIPEVCTLMIWKQKKNIIWKYKSNPVYIFKSKIQTKNWQSFKNHFRLGLVKRDILEKV